LFYLKEKGNYIAHFDEKILNFLLFNDMNIAEDDEKESDTQNLNEKNNEIKNEIVNATKEKKVCEKIDKKEKVIQITQDKKKINLNQEYKGKKIFSGSELIQMLKNPTKFQQKVIQKKNLFDSIYRAVDDFKKEIGYKDSEEQIFKLKDISKDLDVNINELMKKIETNFVKDFANMKIDIKNIKKINEKEKENLDSYLKEIINIYLELQKLKEKINKKIIFYENVIKKYQKIKKDIENNESEVNEQINQINELIKKAASLIKISDIFQNYKIVLKDNISKFPEYREHPNIFNESNIDEFIINDLYEFLTTYLKDGEFSD
jgi:DNA repair exonuclease SbcCD ATPase subunit